MIDGAGLDDLRQLTGDLMLLGSAGAPKAEPQRMPELRRSPLQELKVFQLGVDLKH